MADPTPGQIRELADEVLNEFFHGYRDYLGKEDAHPFANEEDEDAFRELLVGSTTRNKGDLWDGTGWKEKSVAVAKKTAQKHGKRCGEYAKRYKKQYVSLARVLVELKECKTECYLLIDRGKDQAPVEKLGLICEF